MPAQRLGTHLQARKGGAQRRPSRLSGAVLCCTALGVEVRGLGISFAKRLHADGATGQWAPKTWPRGKAGRQDEVQEAPSPRVVDVENGGVAAMIAGRARQGP